MNQNESLPVRFVVCIDNGGYPVSLVLYKIYRVLPGETAVEGGDLRIVDESGEDYLYPATRFADVDLPEHLASLILRAA